MSATITWAIKNSAYVHVSSFEQGVGLNCGCICAECGEAVGSRIFSTPQKESCFFHQSEYSKCTGGQKETELHIMAKRILENGDQLWIPSINTNQKKSYYYNIVHTECKLGKIRPDLILKSNPDHTLLIEIGVTSFIRFNNKKIEEIKSLNIPTLEIDLSSIYRQFDVQNMSSLYQLVENEIINKIDNKHWIWHPDMGKKSDQPNNVQVTSENGSNWKSIAFIITLALLILRLFGRRKT